MNDRICYALNGITFGFDKANGALLELSHPATGNIILNGGGLVNEAASRWYDCPPSLGLGPG